MTTDVSGSRFAALCIAAETGKPVDELVDRPDANTLVALTRSYAIRVGGVWPIVPAVEAASCVAASAGGIPAPEIVDWGYRCGHGYLVYRRVNGTHPSGQPVALAHAGQLLARLHRQVDSARFPRTQLSRPRRQARFQVAMSALPRILSSTCTRWATPRVRAAQADWDRRRDRATHGDFRASNIFEKDGRIVGIVDWTDARRASPESDLGQVDLSDVSAVLDGYAAEAGGPLDHDLIAGYAIARNLALEVGGVLPSTASERATNWWRRRADGGRDVSVVVGPER